MPGPVARMMLTNMTTRRMSKPLARNANGIKEVPSSNVNGQIDKDKDKDKDMGSLAHINISRFETERVFNVMSSSEMQVRQARLKTTGKRLEHGDDMDAHVASAKSDFRL